MTTEAAAVQLAPRALELVAGRGIRAWQVPLVVLAAWVLAVPMPLLDLLGRNGAFLVAHDLHGARLVIAVAAVVVGVPAVLAVAVLALRRLGPVGDVVLAVVVAAGAATVLLTFGTQLTDLPGVLLAAAATIAGGAAAVLAVRSEAGRRGLVALGLVTPAWVLVQFLVLSPAAALVGDQGQETGAVAQRSTPVFVLLLDELPLTSLVTAGGDVDGTLYPGLAALAQEATWYPLATTFSTSTERVVPAVLTGRESDGSAELPVASSYPDTVFNMLGDRDILTVEPITDLCAVEACRQVEQDSVAVGTTPWDVVLIDSALVYLHQVVPGDLAGGLPRIDEGWAGFVADGASAAGDAVVDGNGVVAVPGGDPVSGAAPDEMDAEAHEEQIYEAVWGDSSVAARAYIDSISTATPSSFFFGHMMLPHSPWTHLPDGSRVVSGRHSEPARLEGGGGVWSDDAWLVQHTYQRHLLQVRFADSIVTDFAAAIRDRGLWDEALVIVMADHGVSFEPGLHRRSVETDASAADVLHVPLFVKFPGQVSGGRSATEASVIDVAPTIADVLEITPRPAYQGAVLRPDTTTGVVPAARVLDAAADKYALFDLASADGLYAFGRSAQLLGTRVDDLPVQPPSDLVVVLEDHAGLELVAPGRLSPALVHGSMPGLDPSDAPDEVAIVVDGIVAGLAAPFVRDDEVRFQTIVDPARLPPGRHDVEVHVVEGEGATPSLAPTRTG